MKRIGNTMEGHLIELTGGDIIHLSAMYGMLSNLFNVIKIDQVETTVAFDHVKSKPVRAESHKKGATKSARAVVEKKACEVCSTMFVPATARSRFCSKACTDKDYRAKHNVKPVQVAKCITCNRNFEPKRKDQTCCSTKCRQSAPKKADVVAQPIAKPTIDKAERLAMIRRLAQKKATVPSFVERTGVAPNLEDIPEYQKARSMASEGRES